MRRLAVLGGAPAFPAPLHVGRPNIGERAKLLAFVDEILERRVLSNRGPLVKRLEAELAGRLGVRHCVAVANATIGLEVLARALGLTGEVIVPAFTFVATAHALEWVGLRPVFADIDPATHNLDPADAARRITPRTSAILGVHLWGRACPVEELHRVAADHGLKLIFDAAHAIGCSHGGRPIGGFGQAEVFSFHATKVFNTFEGGAIATHDDVLAARLRLMTNFGFAGYDDVAGPGSNGKMSEIAAAMGLVNLESLDEFVAVNRRNHGLYAAGLAGIPGLRLLGFDEREANNYQYAVAEVDEAQAGLSRDLLIKVLWAENVLARRYFWPGCHRMEPYRSRPAAEQPALPRTDEVAGRVLVLPTGTAVGPDEIAAVCGILAAAVADRDLVQKTLAGKGA